MYWEFTWPLANSDGLIGLVFGVVLVAGFAAMILAFGAMQTRQANAAWGGVAEKLGLRLREGSFWSQPRMSGTIQDFAVLVDVYQTGSGKSRKTFTRVQVSYRSLGLGLALKQEGFLSSVSKLFGFQRDLEVGDRAFDAEVVVDARDPVKLRRFLTPSRRMRIRRYLNNYSRAVITDTSVTCSVSGVIRNVAQLQQMVTSSVSLAWHLSGEREADLNLDRALQAQDAGHPEEALALVQRTTRERPSGEPVVAELIEEKAIQAELVEERLLEGELLTLAGRTEEAHAAFQEARRSAPYDEEIAEWAERPAAGPKSDVAEVLPQRSQPVPEPPSAIEAGVLCHELFGGSSTSYQINQQFDTHRAGAGVRWSGTLKRVEPFSYDFVFGNEPGCRAVIMVHELDTATYGDRSVSAIVRFPAEALEQLRGKEQQEVAFSGKLHKVDALLRNIYVTDGRVG